jgi:flavin reductase (DIM6/NTAB) family NADH-FMN oxidoreductase RutF
MNASSAEFDAGISEPERVGIEMSGCLNVKPPRVARSPVVLECRYNTTVRLTGADGRTNPSSIVFGEVVGVHVDDRVIVDGRIDVVKMQPIARLGYTDYSVVDELFTMPRPAKPAGEPAARQPIPQY